MLDALVHDVRHAVRHLGRSPAFTAAAVLTLALGAGANVGLFSILNGLMLQELAVSDPRGLIGISSRHSDDARGPIPITVVREFEREGSPLRDVCAYGGGGSAPVELSGGPVRMLTVYLSGRCLATFGVAPVLGRGIGEDDAPLTSKGAPVAVLGHAVWTRAFGADPGAIGRTIRVQGVDLTIIGVMPPRFTGIQAETDVDLFVPFDTIAPAAPGRRPNAAQLIARLAPGASLDEAAAQVATLWPSALEAVLPPKIAPRERTLFVNGQPRVERMATGVSTHRNRYGRTLTIVFGLTGILLVLACVNLGGLLLSRLIARGPEMAVRRALGGSRWRVARQMAIENVLLAMLGAALALPMSYAVILPFRSVYQLTRGTLTLHLTPDVRVIGLTVLVGLCAGLLMSVLPVWMAGRQQRNDAAWDRTITSATSRWARGLLVVQVALSVVMLAGAGLLARSLFLLQSEDLGVNTDGLLIVEKEPLPDGYRAIDTKSYYSTLIGRVRALPGVREAGAARVFPRMAVTPPWSPVGFVGEAEGGARATLEVVTPGHFEAVGIGLVVGRYPSWDDDVSSTPVAVVSERLARTLDPGGDVVGRRIDFGDIPANQNLLIVGVVRRATLGSPRETDLPIVYRPGLQMPSAFIGWSSLAIRVDGDPSVVAAGVTEALKAGGREYAYAISPAKDMIRRAPNNERVATAMAVGVGVVAVLIAFVGVFGLLAYSVSRRTREIGVRVAIGADSERVLRMVLREGLVLTAFGVALGVPAALAAARLVRSLMFGITESDPLTLASVAVFFLVLGCAAGLAPARRAARVDPAVALRTE